MNDLDRGDFDQLLTAARSGSTEAIGRLIERYRPYLLLVANQDLDAALRSKLGASDVVQETLLTAQHSIAGFRGSTQADLLAWLRGILVNDLKETRRKYKNTAKRQVGREASLSADSQLERMSVELPSGERTPSTETVAKEEAEALRQAMDRLSDDHRQVLHLRNWQQLPFEEIGQRLGRSADAARKLWSRAVMELQRELKDCVGKNEAPRE